MRELLQSTIIASTVEATDSGLRAKARRGSLGSIIMVKLGRIFALLFIVLLIGVAAGFTLYQKWQEGGRANVHESELITSFRNVIKLAVLEVRLNQIYEMNKENLQVSALPVPFTSQQSLITISGQALVGYDLENVEVHVRLPKKEIELIVPSAEVLSLDIDFRFVREKDSFLNRISANDRNQIMTDIKKNVRKELTYRKMQEKIRARAQELLAEIGKVSGYKIHFQYRPHRRDE